MRQKLAWSITALIFVGLMGLSGAYFKAQENILACRHAQERLTKDLERAKQELASAADCPAAPMADATCAEDRTALERALAESQQAQRELTYELQVKSSAPTPNPPAAQPETSEAFPAYLALRRAVMSGKMFADEWTVLQHVAPPLPEAIVKTLSAQVGGIPTRKELRETLQATLRERQKVALVDASETKSWKARLAPYISIRKITKSDPLEIAAEAGDIDAAAEILSQQPAVDFLIWQQSYETRRSVIDALSAIEPLLALPLTNEGER
ncbi:MAG: hypothetical protein ACK5R5_00435 [Alphaproteobacteria bacterium]